MQSDEYWHRLRCNLTPENLFPSDCPLPSTFNFPVDTCSCLSISWYMSHQYDRYRYSPRAQLWVFHFPWIWRKLISSQEPHLTLENLSSELSMNRRDPDFLPGASCSSLPSDRETSVKQECLLVNSRHFHHTPSHLTTCSCRQNSSFKCIWRQRRTGFGDVSQVQTLDSKDPK